MENNVDNKLPLDDLYKRHSGLTASLSGTFTETAAVCLNRHHTSPVEIEISTNRSKSVSQVTFLTPDDRTLNAWANDIDTTEAGAYGICLAAVEAKENLVAVRRAETLTGADWYVAEPGSDLDDMEECFRLEVSGVDSGNKTIVESRLRQKIEQTRKGSSNLPAIASVVGFKEKLILIHKVMGEK